MIMDVREKIRNSKYGVNGNYKKSPSSAYEKYFEGYAEYRELNKNGKGTHIRRVYTGDIYRQELARTQRIAVRIAYLVMYIFAVVMHVVVATRPLLMNYAWYVALPQALVLPASLWVCIVLFSYLPAPQDMTVFVYKSGVKPFRSATSAMAACFCFSAAMELVFLACNPEDAPHKVILCAIAHLTSAGAVWLMNRMENRIHYQKQENKKSKSRFPQNR